MEDWLNAPIPLQNGEKACAGYKVLHFITNGGPDPGFTRETYIAMNKTFCLSPVELHTLSKAQGGCGMFLQDDESYRKTIPLVSTFAVVILLGQSLSTEALK